MTTKNSNPLLLVIFGVLMLAGGGALAYFIGKPTVDEANASRTWPKVKGIVTESRVDSHTNKGKVSYSSHVEYEYSIDNKETLYGNRIWIGQYSSSNKGEHKKIVSKYPSGAQVDVFYNPKAPEFSVLEPGAVYSTYIALGIGLMFAVIGGLLLAGPLINFGIIVVMMLFGAKDSSGSNFDQTANHISNDRQESGDLFTVEDDRFKDQHRGKQSKSQDGFLGIPGD